MGRNRANTYDDISTLFFKRRVIGCLSFGFFIFSSSFWMSCSKLTSLFQLLFFFWQFSKLGWISISQKAIYLESLFCSVCFQRIASLLHIFNRNKWRNIEQKSKQKLSMFARKSYAEKFAPNVLLIIDIKHSNECEKKKLPHKFFGCV